MRTPKDRSEQQLREGGESSPNRPMADMERPCKDCKGPKCSCKGKMKGKKMKSGKPSSMYASGFTVDYDLLKV